MVSLLERRLYTKSSDEDMNNSILVLVLSPHIFADSTYNFMNQIHQVGTV